MSTLAKLLALALPSGDDRPTRRYAQENFTTEALAGAARRNFEPLRRALIRAGVTVPVTCPDQILTQVAYAPPSGRIILDLILSWEANRHEVWIEVKVNAPLSGDHQLTTYRATADWLTAVDATTRELVLLSSSDLRARERDASGRSAFLRWQSLVEAINEEDVPGDGWNDLADFLEELGMTVDAAFPITAHEIASLGDAWRLFRKGNALITAANRSLREAGFAKPASEFVWRDGDIRRGASYQFEHHGRVTLSGGARFPVTYHYGLAPDLHGATQVALWVEVDPRRTSSRQATVAWFSSRVEELPSFELVRDDRWYHGWPVLVASESPVNLPSLDEASAWLFDRLRELANAGYFDLVAAQAARPAPEKEADEADPIP